MILFTLCPTGVGNPLSNNPTHGRVPSFGPSTLLTTKNLKKKMHALALKPCPVLMRFFYISKNQPFFSHEEPTYGSDIKDGDSPHIGVTVIGLVIHKHLPLKLL